MTLSAIFENTTLENASAMVIAEVSCLNDNAQYLKEDYLSTVDDLANHDIRDS